MARHHVETLKKLRMKMVEQRRAMATRQAGPTHAGGYESIISLQASIDATDRAIADEERLMTHGPAEAETA